MLCVPAELSEHHQEGERTMSGFTIPRRLDLARPAGFGVVLLLAQLVVLQCQDPHSLRALLSLLFAAACSVGFILHRREGYSARPRTMGAACNAVSYASLGATRPGWRAETARVRLPSLAFRSCRVCANTRSELARACLIPLDDNDIALDIARRAVQPPAPCTMWAVRTRGDPCAVHIAPLTHVHAR